MRAWPVPFQSNLVEEAETRVGRTDGSIQEISPKAIRLIWQGQPPLAIPSGPIFLRLAGRLTYAISDVTFTIASISRRKSCGSIVKAGVT